MRENIPVIRLRTDLGDVVARDGIVLCFFMRSSHHEVAPSVWRALQAYRRATPPQSLAWYGSDDGDTLPLDDKGWEHIRWQILERQWAAACYVDLEEDASEVGGYHFEYRGRQLEDPNFSGDEDWTSGVSFTFPTEYLLERGPGHLRTLALELARELPFSFGYASLAVISPHGMWYAARRELLPLLARYRGLDLYHLEDTSRVIGTRARGAYWLTFLGQPLLGQLGGPEALHQKLPFPEVSFQPLDGERLLLTLTEWPETLDTEKKFSPSQYRELALLLEPFFLEERTGWFSFDKEPLRRWMRRLCQ
ncbi:type VI immunity family protein [Hyalangium gracile]|uniref:type VI immunity family protein n=1 Tax=Hyalangium gracile TaxID=394092 RepID=UPI001CCA381C|nr:type VI immunity family protein [Hyalangium gracile]